MLAGCGGLSPRGAPCSSPCAADPHVLCSASSPWSPAVPALPSGYMLSPCAQPQFTVQDPCKDFAMIGNASHPISGYGNPGVAIPRSVLTRIDDIVSCMEREVLDTMEAIGDPRAGAMGHDTWFQEHVPADMRNHDVHRQGKSGPINLAKLRQLVAAVGGPGRSRHEAASDQQAFGTPLRGERGEKDVYRDGRGNPTRADSPSQRHPRHQDTGYRSVRHKPKRSHNRTSSRKASFESSSRASDLQAYDDQDEDLEEEEDGEEEESEVENEEAEITCASTHRSGILAKRSKPAKLPEEDRVHQLQTRLTETERQLSAARTAEESHEKLRTAYRNRMAELEKELEHYRSADEEMGSRSTVLRARISELEQELVESHSAAENQSRQTRARVSELESELSAARMRISELEQDSVNARVSEERNNKKRVAEVARSTQLEQQIVELRLVEERQARQLSSNAQRALQLEQDLQNSRDSEGRQGRQMKLNEARILNLEQELSESRGKEERLTRQLGSHVARVGQLEKELHESQEAEGRQARQHAKNSRKIAELEHELEEVRALSEQHARQHKTLRLRVAELEEELSHTRLSGDNNSEIQASHRARETQLGGDLVAASEIATEVLLLQRKAEEDASKIDQLQRQVAEAKLVLPNLLTFREEHSKAIARVAELEKEQAEALCLIGQLKDSEKRAGVVSAVANAAEGRASFLEETFSEEQLSTSRLTAELARAQEKLGMEEKLRADAESVARTEAGLRADAEATARKEVAALAEAQAKLAQLEANLIGTDIQTIQVEAAERLPAVSSVEPLTPIDMTALSRSDAEPVIESSPPSSVSSAGRESDGSDDRMRWPHASPEVEVEFPLARHYTFELLPEVRDPFLRDCRETLATLNTALHKASAAHVAILRAQLVESAAPTRAAAEEARVVAKVEIEEQAAELQGLFEEAGMQCQLTSDERGEVVERLGLILELCQIELELLGAPPATLLTDVPDEVISALLNLSSGLPLRGSGEKHGSHVACWAAQNGRLDVLEYLVAQVSIESRVLEVYDDHGRSPLYYATQQASLTWWFRTGHHTTVPIHRSDLAGWRRPHLDAPHHQVLENLEMHGWEAASWSNDFNLLHWAAMERRSDLCRYLVRALGADLNAQDEEGRTALDLAREARAVKAVECLQELQDEIRSDIVGDGEGRKSLREQSSRRSTVRDFVMGCMMNFQRQESTSSTSSRRSQGRRGSVDSVGSPVRQGSADSVGTASDQDLGIPPAYIDIIDQIDEVGWEGMDWARGYTLLHWAAKNNMEDLCARFMLQGGDPNDRDDTGRDAFDYAREFDSSEALAQLRRGPPADLSFVPPVPKASHRMRTSVKVEADLLGMENEPSSPGLATE